METLAWLCTVGAVLLAAWPAAGAPAPSDDAEVARYNYVVGTQTIGVRYGFTEDTRLVETARAILAMGSNVLKIHMAGGYEDSYALPRREDIRSLVELARDELSYKAVLDMPFSYYLIWTYPFTGMHWQDGLTEQEAQDEYRGVYDFSCYLLKTYSGSGKAFYLGHWEGDWYLHPGYDPRKTPAPAALQGMIDWLNVRQRAVDDARRDTPHSQVSLYHYTEVNLVQKAMKGEAALTNSVLPNTNVDYVSYSSYDSLGGEGQVLVDRLKAALSYIESKLPAKDGIPGKRVFIGEYGFPSESVGAEKQAERSRDVMRAALEWGCPFCLYWEMYCNEVKDGVHRGFWLIDDRGEKQPAYHLHQRYYTRARRYVSDFRAQNGRVPTPEEFSAEAVRLLG